MSDATRRPRHVPTVGSRGTAEERFLRKVNKNGPIPSHRPDLGPCWLWTGGTAGSGYGVFHPPGPRGTPQIGAHCWAYLQSGRPIPGGYEVDHLCHPDDGSCPGGKTDPHRLCVNPAHLAAVPGPDNNRRSMSATARNARKTHCVNGHEFTEENTYRKLLPNGTYGRECRTCIRARDARPEDRTRAGGWISPLAAANAAKTHCPQGHEYTTENTVYDKSSNGRRCKTCLRERRHKARKAA